MDFNVFSIDDLQDPIEHLRSQKPHLIFLDGGLGAGKTTFVSEFLKTLDPESFLNLGVMSPTYSILNEYSTSLGLISHYDLYRVDPKSYDLEDVVESIEGSAMTFVEWSGRFPEIRELYQNQEGVCEVKISQFDDEKRLLRISLTKLR